jgi:hypothetical protein
MRWSEMPEHSNYAVAEWDITDAQVEKIDGGFALEDGEHGFSWGVEDRVIYLWIDSEATPDTHSYAMIFEDYLRSQYGVDIS